LRKSGTKINEESYSWHERYGLIEQDTFFSDIGKGCRLFGHHPPAPLTAGAVLPGGEGRNVWWSLHKFV